MYRGVRGQAMACLFSREVKMKQNTKNIWISCGSVLFFLSQFSAQALPLFSSPKDRLKSLVKAEDHLHHITEIRTKIQSSQKENLTPAAQNYTLLKKEYDTKQALIKKYEEELKTYIEAEIQKIEWEIVQKTILIRDTTTVIAEARKKNLGKDIILKVLAEQTTIGSEVQKLASQAFNNLWKQLGGKANVYLNKLGLTSTFTAFKTDEELLMDWNKSLLTEKAARQKALGLRDQLYHNKDFAQYLIDIRNKDIKGGWLEFFTRSAQGQKNLNTENILQKIQEIISLKHAITQLYPRLSQAIKDTGGLQTQIIQQYSMQAQAETTGAMEAIKKAKCSIITGLNDLTLPNLRTCLLKELHQIGFQKLSSFGSCYQLRQTTVVNKDIRGKPIYQVTEQFDAQAPYAKILACVKEYIKK